MSKFIQTQCGSLVNVDTISSIQKRYEEINDDRFRIDIVIINNENQEFIYNTSMFYQSVKDKNLDGYVYFESFCLDNFNEIKDCILSPKPNMILETDVDDNNLPLLRMRNGNNNVNR